MERQVLRLPDGADPLQTFENGSPLGDTRFMNFGEGVQATLIGDDYVLVTGAGAGTSEFDFIVDSTLVASEPENFLFRGIGEALTYMNTLGRENCIGLVRARPGGGVTYTETANWSNPDAFTLIGVAGTPNTNPASPQYPQWNHGGFSGNPTNYVTCINMALQDCFFGTSSATNVYCHGCLINSQSNSSPVFASGQATFSDCHFLGFPTLVSNASGYAHIFGGTITFVAAQTGALTPVPAGGTLVIEGTQFSGSINRSAVNIPRRSHIAMGNGGTAGAGGGVIAFVCAAGTSSVDLYMDLRAALSPGASITVTGTTATGKVVVFGDYTDITIAPMESVAVRVSVSGASTSAGTAVDIGGPAQVDLKLGRLAKAIFRGRAVAALIAAESDLGNSATTGPLLSFVNADECSVILAANGSGTSGAISPYAFDASSANNVLVFNGAATWGAAGTDAGSNNRVLPEGASPPPAGGTAPANADYLVGTANADLSAEIVVGPTPGGELGGTWGTPTVDVVHSGSQHAIVLSYWYQDNVVASQTGVVLTLDGNAARAAVPMVRAGSITGIVVRSNEARSAGTLTVEVTKNGTGVGLTAVLDGTNTTAKATTQALGTDTFVAGDEIGVILTTDAGWLPITADIVALVEVVT